MGLEGAIEVGKDVRRSSREELEHAEELVIAVLTLAEAVGNRLDSTISIHHNSKYDY